MDLLKISNLHQITYLNINSERYDKNSVTIQMYLRY